MLCHTFQGFFLFWRGRSVSLISSVCAFNSVPSLLQTLSYQPHMINNYYVHFRASFRSKLLCQIDPTRAKFNEHGFCWFFIVLLIFVGFSKTQTLSKNTLLCSVFANSFPLLALTSPPLPSILKYCWLREVIKFLLNSDIYSFDMRSVR